jgi:hypothetical protein
MKKFVTNLLAVLSTLINVVWFFIKIFVPIGIVYVSLFLLEEFDKDRPDFEIHVLAYILVLIWAVLFFIIRPYFSLKLDLKKSLDSNSKIGIFILWLLAYSFSFYFMTPFYVAPGVFVVTVLAFLFVLGLVVFVAIFGSVYIACLSLNARDAKTQRSKKLKAERKRENIEKVSFIIYKVSLESWQKETQTNWSVFLGILTLLYLVMPHLSIEKIYNKTFPPADYYHVIQFKPGKYKYGLPLDFRSSFDYVVETSQLVFLVSGSELEHVYTHEQFRWNGKEKILIKTPTMREFLKPSIFDLKKMKDEEQIKFHALLQKGL